MTRIPELERELVAAAARLKAPAPAQARAAAALAAAAVAVVVVPAVVVATEKGPRSPRDSGPGTPTSQAGSKLGTDGEPGVRSLSTAGLLTVSLLPWALARPGTGSTARGSAPRAASASPRPARRAIRATRARSARGSGRQAATACASASPRTSREYREVVQGRGPGGRPCRLREVRDGAGPRRSPDAENRGDRQRVGAALRCLRPSRLRELHDAAAPASGWTASAREQAGRELHTGVAGVPALVPGRASRGGRDPGQAVRRRKPEQARRGQVLERQDGAGHKRGAGARAGRRLVDREVPG